MATLLGRLSLFMSFAYQNALDHQNISGDLIRQMAIDLATGSGAGQANAIFSDQRALSSGGTDNLDLSGSLTDAFGTVLSFTSIKGIIIEADPTNGVDITVGNGTNPFVGPFGAGTHTVAVRPGGLLVFFAPQTGWSVTNSTADILKILAGAGAVNYRIHIIGVV